MNLTTWRLPVPGTFTGCVLDIETRKVPCAYRMANGELLKRRWQVTLAGAARDGEVVLVEGDEPSLLDELATVLAGHRAVAYSATREFDEMILRGRFTNARRAHAPEPFFPALPGAEGIGWRNLKVGHPVTRSATDLSGRDVPAAWGSERRRELVMVHNLRDVAELILVAGDPDAECATWCERVLNNDEFAYGEIFAGE
jgi:hypothetical protein